MRSFWAIVFGVGVLGLCAGPADAGARPKLSLAQARGVATRLAQSAASAAGSDGVASVGACSRFTSWRVGCKEVIYLDTGTCTETIVVSNSLTTSKGYYHRTIAFKGLKCVGAPSVSPPVVAPPVAPPSEPTELPQGVGQTVATNYVDGMMRQAYATYGGVSVCYLPIGFSDTCAFTYGGTANDGSAYFCSGDITVNGIYEVTGWQTTVNLNGGPICT
jgi:hypothetical protein